MSTTVATIPINGLRAGPGSPIFRQVQTTTDAPLFRSKEMSKNNNKKRYSLKKMMSKIKSSQRLLKINKSSSRDSNEDAMVEPTKLAFEGAASFVSPRLDMVATDDEISSASSNLEQEHVAIHKEIHYNPSSLENTESSNEANVEESKFTEQSTSEQYEQQGLKRKAVNYEMDDEEYVEEKEPETTPCTPSDIVALLLAGALISAQALA